MPASLAVVQRSSVHLRVIVRPYSGALRLFGGVVGGDGGEVVDSGEAVGGQCESGAPGFVFERQIQCPVIQIARPAARMA